MLLRRVVTDPTIRLTNSQLENLISFKWSAKGKLERPKKSSLKGKNKDETRVLKVAEWSKCILLADPCPPVIPEGFDLYYEEGDELEDYHYNDIEIPAVLLENQDYNDIEVRGRSESMDSNVVDGHPYATVLSSTATFDSMDSNDVEDHPYATIGLPLPMQLSGSFDSKESNDVNDHPYATIGLPLP